MGSAVARGLIARGCLDPSDIIVATPHPDKLRELSDSGVKISPSNIDTAKSDLLIIAVKPWKVKEVVDEISSSLDFESIEIALIVAGIKGEELKSYFKPLPRVLSIVMPNTAMAIGESMTFIVPLKGKPCLAVDVFKNLGSIKEIEESQLPAATALASCGIAYALRYVRAAMEGGVEMGFKANEAQEIICQTIKGAADLLLQTNSHPEIEIDKVTTPGGITIKGLNAMEKFGFSNAVIEGLKASRK